MYPLVRSIFLINNFFGKLVNNSISLGTVPEKILKSVINSRSEEFLIGLWVHMTYRYKIVNLTIFIKKYIQIL